MADTRKKRTTGEEVPAGTQRTYKREIFAALIIILLVIGIAFWVNRFFYGFDEPEIGYVLEKKYHRQGLAYEACSAIIDYFKENYSFERIMALSEAENVAGNGLLKKLGFEYECDVKERGRFYQKYSLNIQKTPR